MKVLINTQYGGYSISQLALELIAERKQVPTIDQYSLPRTDPDAIHVFNQLGSEVFSGRLADVSLREITADKYFIDEYDGMETIVTPDQIKWLTA